jgi:hypothetical protein
MLAAMSPNRLMVCGGESEQGELLMRQCQCMYIMCVIVVNKHLRCVYKNVYDQKCRKAQMWVCTIRWQEKHCG